jgi:hypothetical protein
MRHSNSLGFFSFLLVASMFAEAGCGQSSGETAALIPVKGKVSFKGQPVTKGSVRFLADGYGRDASGTLQPDGSFTLSTSKDGDGVVAGEHPVTISGFNNPLASNRALKKYAAGRTSGLTAEVDAEHTEFNFELR